MAAASGTTALSSAGQHEAGDELPPQDLPVAVQALAQVEGARAQRVEGDIATIAFPEGGESAWMTIVDEIPATVQRE